MSNYYKNRINLNETRMKSTVDFCHVDSANMVGHLAKAVFVNSNNFKYKIS